MIAVTFSLPDESREFLRAVQLPMRIGRGVGSAISGMLDGVPIMVRHIGVGRGRAAAETARLLAEVQPAVVLCAGYGGALFPEARLGEIVCDARGSELALPPSARAGRIHTADHVAESVEEKRRLGEQTGALAVDMETAVVAEVCEAAGVRVIGLRAISDRLEDALPVPMEHWFDLAQQRPRVLSLLAFLAGHPSRIAPFSRFVRGLAPARQALAKALVEVISALGNMPQGLASPLPLKPEGLPEISRWRQPPESRQRDCAPAGAPKALCERAIRRPSGADSNVYDPVADATG